MCCREGLPADEIRDVEVECFQEIADQAGAFPGITFVLSGVGEALLYPRFPEAVSCIRQRFAHSPIIVNTNGRLLSGNLAELLLTLDSVLIRVNAACREGYSSLTGTDGYEELTANVEAFLASRRESSLYRDSRRPFVSLQLWETDRTAEEEHAFRKRWEPLLGDNGQVEVKRRTLCGGPVSTAALHARIDKQESGYPCLYLWRSLAVGVDGEIYPCCEALRRRHRSSLRLGNIHRQGLDAAYRSPVLRQARALHLAHRYHEVSDCAECEIHATHKNIWWRLPAPVFGRKWL
ncbi:MAG: SPASM domain-containing protein [Armatimonadetes bacterium]|nr:SPASM domain-containing protein [Armatimonadota bacterium]